MLPMLTLVVLITFMGFFILYNTSEKAVLSNSFVLEKWVQDHHIKGKYLGCILLLIAFTISILFFGTGAGIFLFFVILMCVASVTILIAPLQYLKHKSLFVIFSISLVVELIFS